MSRGDELGLRYVQPNCDSSEFTIALRMRYTTEEPHSRVRNIAAQINLLESAPTCLIG